jgi:hypothetical protein
VGGLWGVGDNIGRDIKLRNWYGSEAQALTSYIHTTQPSPYIRHERCKNDGCGTLWEAALFWSQFTPVGAVRAGVTKLAIVTGEKVIPKVAGLAGRGGQAAKAPARGDDLLEPGPWAKESVPSSAPGKITQAERDALNPIGERFGCHSCGARSPGTKSGNWIGDHQPVSRTVPPGTPQRLFPHCQACSNEQGLWIINLLRRGGL